MRWDAVYAWNQQIGIRYNPTLLSSFNRLWYVTIRYFSFSWSQEEILRCHLTERKPYRKHVPPYPSCLCMVMIYMEIVLTVCLTQSVTQLGISQSCECDFKIASRENVDSEFEGLLK